MAHRRKVNWKFILVVLIALGVLAVIATGLRNWNRQNQSSRGMEEGLLAYEQARWDVAASRLSWYVYNTEDTPEKIPIMLKFAEALLNKRPRSANELNDAVKASPDEGEQFLTYRVTITERALGDGILGLVAVQVESEGEVPPDMISIKTPAAKFAKFEYRGTLETYPLAGYYITGCWFPRSRYWIGNAPVLFNIRLDPLNPDSNNLKCFLPLRPRRPRLVDRWWH